MMKSSSKTIFKILFFPVPIISSQYYQPLPVLLTQIHFSLTPKSYFQINMYGVGKVGSRFITRKRRSCKHVTINGTEMRYLCKSISRIFREDIQVCMFYLRKHFCVQPDVIFSRFMDVQFSILSNLQSLKCILYLLLSFIKLDNYSMRKIEAHYRRIFKDNMFRSFKNQNVTILTHHDS